MASKPVSKVGEKRKASATEKPGSKASLPKRPRLERPSKRDKVQDDGVADADARPSAKPKPKRHENGKFEKKDGRDSGKSKQGPGSRGTDGTTFDRAGQNSRESHAKQKQLALERKAAKPLADDLARTKKLWERLRRKSHVPKDERQQLVGELFGLVTGRMKDFVLKHDAVRAVETAIKYSTPAQRKDIAQELKGAYVQLAESRYAKFLIGKLLAQRDDEIRDLVVAEFYGRVRKLINHPEASWILDDIYRGVATADQKATLLREWYGPEFALFSSATTTTVATGKTTADGAAPAPAPLTADLRQILQGDPGKRSPMMKYLLDMVNGLVQKQMTGFTMLHDAMLQYFLNLKPGTEEQKEFVEMVKADETGDLLKNMAFTKSGARLVCLLLAYGSAKDRRQLLKTYKDSFQLMCSDRHGHAVILAAYDLVDDTVLTSKAILPEILGKNEEKGVQNIILCANDLNARTTILYPFEGLSKALFPAGHSDTADILREIHEIRKTTSKKDDETRRSELVAAVSPHLLAAISTAPGDLISTSFGCQLVTDVLLAAVGDKTKALETMAETAAGEPLGGADADADAAPPISHISQTPFGGKMFKTLVAGGRFDRATGKITPVDPPLGFANVLYPHIKPHVVSWATGPSSFVPLALLEADDFGHKAELASILSRSREALERAATEETADQKANKADEEEDEAPGREDSSKKKQKKKKAAKAERAVGNIGARLLLQKL